MAIDSIIARPTNKVRVMVVAASGCCASELKAVETARPSPSAGAILPSADRDAGGNDRNDRDKSHAVHTCPFVAEWSCFMLRGFAWRPRCKRWRGC